MIQTREKVIDGKQIVVLTHPGRRLNQLKVRLVKLLGITLLRALATLLDSAKPSQGSNLIKNAAAKFMESDIRLSEVALAFESMEQKLEPSEYESLIMEILAFASIKQGEKATPLCDAKVFDDVFAGNMLFMYKIIAFVIEVNFGDFFAVAATSLMKDAAGSVTEKTR